MITPQAPDSHMSTPVTKDQDGNVNISVPYIEGRVGAQYMTGAAHQLHPPKKIEEAMQTVCHDHMTRYNFKKDEAGNWVVPASLFGHTRNVRAQANKHNEIVIDLVQAIMAITGKSREFANQCWRKTLKRSQKLIQSDISGSGVDC